MSDEDVVSLCATGDSNRDRASEAHERDGDTHHQSSGSDSETSSSSDDSSSSSSSSSSSCSSSKEGETEGDPRSTGDSVVLVLVGAAVLLLGGTA